MEISSLILTANNKREPMDDSTQMLLQYNKDSKLVEKKYGVYSLL